MSLTLGSSSPLKINHDILFDLLCCASVLFKSLSFLWQRSQMNEITVVEISQKLNPKQLGVYCGSGKKRQSQKLLRLCEWTLNENQLQSCLMREGMMLNANAAHYPNAANGRTCTLDDSSFTKNTSRFKALRRLLGEPMYNASWPKYRNVLA